MATTKTPEFRKCGCGCGEIVAGKTQFKQGHDARMVSQLTALVTCYDKGGRTARVAPAAFTKSDIELVTGNGDIQARIDEAARAIETYHGEKLANKAYQAMMSGWERYDKPVTRRKEPIAVISAKVGRWVREGYTNSKGEFKYQDKNGKIVVVPKGKYTIAG